MIVPQPSQWINHPLSNLRSLSEELDDAKLSDELHITYCDPSRHQAAHNKLPRFVLNSDKPGTEARLLQWMPAVSIW
jgi:hypothetical protein